MICTRNLLVVALAMFTSAGTFAQAEDVAAPGEDQIQALITQLGADSFHLREEAMAKLVEIGPATESAVEAATNAPDPEVAYRARKILKEIDRSLIAGRRLAFLEGDVAKLKANAASWQRMEKLLGNSRETRELFLKMQIDAGDLLTTAEKDPRACAQEIAQLYTKDQQARRFGGQGLPAGVVIAMVFIGSDEDVPVDASTISRSTSLLYRHKAALGGNEHFQRLLGTWINTKATGTMEYQFLRLAQQFNLKEGVDLARRMVVGTGHNTYKAHAALTLGMLGDKGDIEILEKLVTDDTRIGSIARGKSRIECRLGDVALAMALVLSDQKPKEFGFTNAPDGRPTSSSYYNYGFADDKERQAARAKWKEFEGNQQ